MRKKIVLFYVFPVLLFFSSNVHAQSHDMILEPFATSGQFLDDQIRADTTSSGARQDTERVYILRRDGVYYFNSTITIDGYDLHMKAEDGSGARPMINNLQNGTSGNYSDPLFEVRGNTLDFSNLAIVEWDETQPETLPVMRGAIINAGGANNNIIIDSCVLKGGYSTTIRVGAAGRGFKMTNTIVANSGNGLRSNFGNGRSVDFRTASEDSVLIQNCTLINITDRAVRHFGSGQAPVRNFVFDHNTIISDLATHGCLGLGLVDGKFNVTNSLFVNNFMFGYDTVSNTRYVEFSDAGEFVPGSAKYRMTFISTTPNSDSASATYTVKNNYYSTSPLLKTMWANANPPGILPLQPLTWFISKELGADSTTAFVELQDTIAFKDVPATPFNTVAWYLDPNRGARDKATSTFTVDDDFDRRDLSYFNTTFDASYQTTSPAYTGAENGYPAGDLNWYPNLKSKWENGEILAVGDNNGNTLPSKFSLEQNYPNPFNPTTKIVFNVPKESKVKLAVFNILGEQVATLINEVKPAGRYTIDFDASNLSSGVYLYQLTSQNQILSKKMILLK
jgi:Secretion system C-terminal sorting domain